MFIINVSNNRYAHFDMALKFIMIEMGYEDLSKKTVNDFVENHTGLEDVEIETKILVYCLKSHVKMRKLLFE